MNIWVIIIGIILLISIGYWLLAIVASVLESVAILAVFILIVFGINYLTGSLALTIWILIALTALGLVADYIDQIKARMAKVKEIENNWHAMNDGPKDKYFNKDIDDILYPFAQEVYFHDKLKNSYDYLDMPYGRANAFLNYFDESIATTEPYVLCTYPSEKTEELREYGYIITRNGIYQSDYDSDKNKILFAGLKKYNVTDKGIVTTYIDPETYETAIGRFDVADAMVKETIANMLEMVLKTKFNILLFKDYSNDFIDMNEGYHVNPYLNDSNVEILRDVLIKVGEDMAINNRWEINDEIKNYMNGAQGHGYAAEYANNCIDRLLGRHVINLANLEMVNGHQKLNGADRMVNGVEIQTKYCKTAKESIDAGFFSKHKYVNSEGKPMVREIPRDQYSEGVDYLQDRIDHGDLIDEGIYPGDDARKYVRKGHVTYNQSKAIAQAGTIEGVTIDAISGIVSCCDQVVFSAVIIFAEGIWNGQSSEESMKAAVSCGARIVGKNVAITVVSGQIARKTGYNRNNIGQKINLVFDSYAVVKEASKLITNKISGTQAFRDTVLFLSGTVGYGLAKGAAAIVGVSAGPATAVIGYAAAKATTAGATKVLDLFTEDDRKKMFNIMKEEFMDAVFIMPFSKEEIEEIASATLCRQDLSTIMEDMVGNQDPRHYVRSHVIDTAVEKTLENRSVITKDMYLRQLALVS